jgi:1-acyl-sn-glycerol-3-phosphate acyltransferase
MTTARADLLEQARFDDPLPLGLLERPTPLGVRRMSALLRVGARAIAAGRLAKTEHKRALALHRGCAEIAERFGVRLEVAGCMPRTTSVIVTNHVGYIDPILIGAIMPCAAIAKREVAGWPLLGGICDAVGVQFVDRDDVMSGAIALRRAARLLSAGVSVLNFPEGTTTDGDTVLPFRRGVFGLAARLGVDVVPAVITVDRNVAWTGDAPLMPHLWATAGRRQTLAHLEVLPPVRAFRGETAQAFADRTRAIIADRVAR